MSDRTSELAQEILDVATSICVYMEQFSIAVRSIRSGGDSGAYPNETQRVLKDPGAVVERAARVYPDPDTAVETAVEV